MLRTDFSIEVCSKLIFPRNSQYSPPSIREIALVFRIFIDVSKRMKMLHVHEILVLSTAQTCTFHLSFIFNFWNGIQLFVTILENALHLHFDRRILPRICLCTQYTDCFQSACTIQALKINPNAYLLHRTLFYLRHPHRFAPSPNSHPHLLSC